MTYPALGEGVPTFEQLESEYGTATDELCQAHESIIESILEEEEQLISKHRSHIDEVVSVVKEEMSLLNDVDKPGSDVEQYVELLDATLLKKIQVITQFRSKLLNFHKHLKTEEQMSKLYQRNQELAASVEI